MYEVVVLNLKNNEEFTKMFFDRSLLDKFVNKVTHSSKLKLLSIIDNSYMYD